MNCPDSVSQTFAGQTGTPELNQSVTLIDKAALTDALCRIAHPGYLLPRLEDIPGSHQE
jgi:hypothetical protein